MKLLEYLLSTYIINNNDIRRSVVTGRKIRGVIRHLLK